MFAGLRPAFSTVPAFGQFFGRRTDNGFNGVNYFQCCYRPHIYLMCCILRAWDQLFTVIWPSWWLQRTPGYWRRDLSSSVHCWALCRRTRMLRQSSPSGGLYSGLAGPQSGPATGLVIFWGVVAQDKINFWVNEGFYYRHLKIWSMNWKSRGSGVLDYHHPLTL